MCGLMKTASDKLPYTAAWTSIFLDADRRNVPGEDAKTVVGLSRPPVGSRSFRSFCFPK